MVPWGDKAAFRPNSVLFHSLQIKPECFYSCAFHCSWPPPINYRLLWRKKLRPIHCCSLRHTVIANHVFYQLMWTQTQLTTQLDVTPWLLLCLLCVTLATAQMLHNPAANGRRQNLVWALPWAEVFASNTTLLLQFDLSFTYQQWAGTPKSTDTWEWVPEWNRLPSV